LLKAIQPIGEKGRIKAMFGVGGVADGVAQEVRAPAQ
jgi:hypothetical protein